ncbi:MAG: type I-E CRISPR-associated protein Cas7/Cse4/CasC [Acidimicrobiia bacterium]
MASRFVDVHIIQTVPPSNLNRDDAGSPKQAVYGGVRRARVSSQAWKRATRKLFAEKTPPLAQATRTQRIAKLLTDRLTARTELDEDRAHDISSALLEQLGIKKKEKQESDTAYLLFFGRAQIESLVELVIPLLPEIADLEPDALVDALSGVSVEDALTSGHPIDVALFGRMVADLPHLNVDAAVQVAHAISTHPVETEFDYYTAVDDEKSRAAGDDAGAGMIGTVEFNSATLYRYASVAVELLKENLDGEVTVTVKGVRDFVDGFVRSIPSGHQNAFAHRTLPDAVVVVTREDQPVNLVSAFEEPVPPRQITTQSIVRLAGELESVAERWGLEPNAVLANYRDLNGSSEAVAALGDSVRFDQLLDSLEALISEAITQ